MTARAALAALDAEALWGAVLAAGAGSRTGAAGTVARLCRSGGSSRLGWIAPPPWGVVSRGLRAIRSALAADEVILLGTGGWCFAAQALCEVTGRPGRLRTLDSLDPAAIESVTAAGVCGARGFLAISASGTTLETRRLAAAVSPTPPGRLVWLRDDAAPPHAFALSPRGARDQVAMLGAPLSMAFLAAADIVDGAALGGAYRGFLERYRFIGAEAARRAARVAAAGPVGVHVAVPWWAGPGLRRWLLQLGRQVLCGKSRRFRPSFEVTGPGGSRAGDAAGLNFAALPRRLPALLDLCYAASVFVACVGLRAGVRVAAHPHVREYKDRVADADPDRDPATPVAAADLPEVAAAWLAGRHELSRLHVVRYGSAAPEPPGAERFRAVTGRRCEVHDGSAWNHHSFQAVYADPGTAVLLLTQPAGTDGAGPGPLATAARTLRQIAIATHRALPERSLLVRARAGGGE